MRVCENGAFRDMTPAEVSEIVQIQQEQPPEQPPTIDQRVADLEEAFNMILEEATK